MATPYPGQGWNCLPASSCRFGYSRTPAPAPGVPPRLWAHLRGTRHHRARARTWLRLGSVLEVQLVAEELLAVHPLAENLERHDVKG